MKMKTFIHLFVVGFSLLPAVLRSQDQLDSPVIVQKRAEEAAARQEAVAKQADESAVQKAQAEQWYENQLHQTQELGAKQQAQAEGESKRANTTFQNRLNRLQAIIRREPGSAGQSLVIRSSELDPKEQANLEEDLAVMSHLLQRSVGSSLGVQTQGGPVLGVNLVFGPGQNPTGGLYLEGYGGLFTLSVGFPLLPSPKNDEEKENPSTDSAWNEARQEVFGQQRMDGNPAYVRGEEYDERKVSRLKDAVLEALKNAIHIRGLKNDDSVTVCVFGGVAALPIKVKSANKQSGPSMKELYGADQRESRSTMLTIRVKKSDVDAFAKDKLNLDDFRKKAKIIPYAGPDSSPGVFVAGSGGGSFGRAGGTFGGGVGFGANPGH
jgi:hypothetical protein